MIRQSAGSDEIWRRLAGFPICIIGTCAVFYVFFLCRMLGAGDIKLMSLCTGILGVWDGFFVIFLGLFLAAAGGAFVLCSEGILWERLERLSGFVIRWGRDGKLREYPAEAGKERMIRLGPYLFLGYCIWLTFKACG